MFDGSNSRFNTVGMLNLVLRAFIASVVFCGLMSIGGCINRTTPLTLDKLQIADHTELRSHSKESHHVILVERESGGLVVVTEKRLAYYDRDFNFERGVDFKHRYIGFGLIQGPQGPWFAGYEWWSWMFGVAHNMDFAVHAMPLGNSEPTYTWPCKNCNSLWVRRYAEPFVDILYAASVRQVPPWKAFDIGTGQDISGSSYEDLVDTMGKGRSRMGTANLELDLSQRAFPYASKEWWKYAYATCTTDARILQGVRRSGGSRCVWHPQQSNSETEYIVKLDGSQKRLILLDGDEGEEPIDTWDLSALVDIKGFSDIIGWFRFPDSTCDHATAQSFSSKPCAKTIAVVSGTWEACHDNSRCERATGIFKFEDGGSAVLLDLIPSPSRAAVRLSDGRIVVSVGRSIVLFDPPESTGTET